MRDPFAERSNQKLYREAQIWMAVFACLLTLFFYLTFKRFSGDGDRGARYIAHPEIAVGNEAAEETAAAPAPQRSLLDIKRPQSSSVKFFPPPVPLAESKVISQRTAEIAGPAPEAKQRLSFAVTGGDQSVAVTDWPKQDSVPKLSLGQQRAQTLAKVTETLPATLKKIQSSVQRASAELPVVDHSNQWPAAQPKVDPPVVATNDFEPVPMVTIARPEPKLPTRDLKFSAARKPPSIPRPLTAQQPPAITKEAAAVVSETAESPKLGFVPAPKVLKGNSTQVKAPPITATPVQQNASGKAHTVLAGDSFFVIAQKYYHDGRWFRALYQANRDQVENFNALTPGTTLVIPDEADLAKRYPQLDPSPKQEFAGVDDQNIYLTTGHDTLFDIARRKLGQGSRYADIISQNRSQLPAQVVGSDLLPANLRLVLPEASLQ